MKLGPLPKSEICASVRGLDDKRVTHIALMLYGAGDTALDDVVAVVVGMELLGLEDNREVIGFEQPPLIVCMYLLKLLSLSLL